MQITKKITFTNYYNSSDLSKLDIFSISQKSLVKANSFENVFLKIIIKKIPYFIEEKTILYYIKKFVPQFKQH